MKSFYLVTGDNGPDKEAFLDALKKETPKNSAGPRPLTVLFASELSDDVLFNAVAGGSLFPDTRLILVRELEVLKSSALKILAQSVGSPAPATVVAVEGRRLPKISKEHPFLAALAEDHPWVEVKTFDAPPPYKMDQWMTEFTRRRFRRALEPSAARLLQEIAGDQPETLAQELEKIDIVLPPGAPVNPQEIRRYAAPSRSRNPWDLAHPVGLKDTAGALAVLKNLLDFFHPAALILHFLSDHFVRLTRFKAYFVEQAEALERIERLIPQGFRAREEVNTLLARAANDSGYAKRTLAPGGAYVQILLPRVLDQLKNHTLDELLYAVRLLASAEYALRTGRLRADFTGLSTLVLFLIHAGLHRAELAI